MIAAITYDQDYDRPARLKAYGNERGFVFGANSKMLRCVTGFDRLDGYLKLGVSYGPALPNVHMIEIDFLGPDGRVLGTHTRMSWTATDLAENIANLVHAQAVLSSQDERVVEGDTTTNAIRSGRDDFSTYACRVPNRQLRSSSSQPMSQ